MNDLEYLEKNKEYATQEEHRKITEGTELLDKLREYGYNPKNKMQSM